MNDKITKQQIYSELTIRLDKIEYMLEKLLAFRELESKEWKVVINNTPIQDSEQFDETYK